MGKKIEKRPFVVALPKELDKAVGTVVNYSEVPKLGLSMATTPSGAISHYLHRQGFSNANLMINKLKQMGGRQKGVTKYTCDFSNIESIDSSGVKVEVSIHDRNIAEEVFIADFLAKRRGGSARDYLKKAREIISGGSK